MNSKRTNESVYEVANGTVTVFQNPSEFFPNGDSEEVMTEDFGEMKSLDVEKMGPQDRNIPSQFRSAIFMFQLTKP